MYILLYYAGRAYTRLDAAAAFETDDIRVLYITHTAGIMIYIYK